MGLIYVDTCLIIYAFEDHPSFGSAVRRAFGEVAAGSLVVSPLVKLECLVSPLRSANVVLQRRYEEGLALFESLPMNEQVFLHAAELRARFNLKTPDALHLATAQHHGCEALWTNDERLNVASRGLARSVL